MLIYETVMLISVVILIFQLSSLLNFMLLCSQGFLQLAVALGRLLRLDQIYRMASTSSSGRGYCKHNVAGKACRCQEWSEPSGNDLACDCCAHHMSFHESYHPIKSGFGRCLKEFGEGRSLYEDGCQEFYSSTADARRCEGCGCHRNIHEKVMAVGNLALNVCSQPTPNVDCSAALMEPSYKRLKLDCANISVRVGDRGNVIETNDDINLKSGVSTTANR